MKVPEAADMKYDFTLVLKDSPELTEELADKLFAAGCDDGSPGMCGAATSIDFHREASSLEEAIRSAVANVSATGCIVARVEIEVQTLVPYLPDDDVGR
jgi:hypothetical protein